MAQNQVKLQKQIRDNALEVKEHVKDIQDWAINDMARELAENMKEDLNTAPIRGKNKPINLELDLEAGGDRAEDKNMQKKAKRVVGSDYSAWDKFDVDAACKEVDMEEDADPAHNEDIVRRKAMDLRSKSLASEKKDLGNKYMQQKNYPLAIQHYTEGVIMDPKNSILLANRAQAYINIQEFESAAFDCDNALKIDPTFVKAYYRRARANFALGRVLKAQDDLKKVLTLEPQNKEARTLLNEIERTSRKQGLGLTTQSRGNYINRSELTNGHNKWEFEEKEKKPTVIYPRIVQPIEKPPHLQSKRSLFSVYVKVKGEEKENKMRRTDSSNSTNWSLSNGNGINNKSSTSSCNSGTTTPSTSQINSPISPDLNELNLSDSFETMRVGSITIPEKPKTSVQFMNHWKLLKPYSTSAAQYLLQMKAGDFLIFDDTMESSILSDILDTLVWEFIPREWDFTECLEGLTKIRRLKTLILFLTEKDRANARKLISLCPRKELQDFYLTTYKF